MKFAAVGASGVVVNLGTLALLRFFRVHTNLASAIAIEVSILSNFAINHLWTFGDRRHESVSLWRQGAKFHLVSLGGGIIQFVTFVALNVAWLFLFFDQTVIDGYAATADSPSFFDRWIVHPFVQPPDEAVGNLVYLSQLIGIGTAMVWNYLLNFYWTWAATTAKADPDGEALR